MTNTDKFLENNFIRATPKIHSVQVFIRLDKASGQLITHFRLREDSDWIPAPIWNMNSPQITLLDAERWNLAPAIAKYSLLLLKFFVPNIRQMMTQPRKFKWNEGVEITKYSFNWLDNTGSFTVETDKDNRAIEQLMFDFLEDHPLNITDYVRDIQLELFDVPLLLAPAY